ncbi:MAG: efflux RND transporter periplasmic adaptor subunit, partial [Anaerolineales bacterium]|nr:efflux RND transporter periplasmic adaptor subunit [Anaerolineales bacterium]
MKKTKTLWITVIALMAGAGLYGYYIVTTLKSNQETTDQSGSLETAVARNGDLSIIVSGSGQVIPASEIGLDFDENGTIIESLAKVGDQVEAGDVLARLQSDTTEAELAADIAEAELAVLQAERNLADLYATAELEAAQALIDLEDAQQAMEDLTNLELEEAAALLAIAQAENAIAIAEMMLYIYNSSPSEEDIYTAYASLLFKQEDLDDLEKQLVTTLKSIP